MGRTFPFYPHTREGPQESETQESHLELWAESSCGISQSFQSVSLLSTVKLGKCFLLQSGVYRNQESQAQGLHCTMSHHSFP